MTGSSNDPRAFCECTRQGNAAAAPAKKGRGMAAFANLGGGCTQNTLKSFEGSIEVVENQFIN